MTKLGGEIDVGVLRASGTHDPVRACSVEVQWGSDRTTVHQRRGIAAAGRLAHGDARHKSSGAVRWWSCGAEAGSNGVEGECAGAGQPG